MAKITRIFIFNLTVNMSEMTCFTACVHQFKTNLLCSCFVNETVQKPCGTLLQYIEDFIKSDTHNFFSLMLSHWHLGQSKP